MKNIKILEYNAFNSSLESYWNKIANFSNHSCFQSYDWCFNWYINVGINRDIDLKIIVVIENDRPIMLLPFVIEKSLFLKKLKFISYDLADYTNIIYLDTLSQKKISSVFDFCIGSINGFDILIFDKVPSLINLKKNLFINSFIKKKRGVSYQMLLPNNKDDLSKIIKKKVFSDTKRQIRRLRNDYNVKFNFVSNLHDIDTSLLDEFINQKRARFNSTGAKDIFNDIIIQNFYKNYYAKFSNVNLHFSWLTANNEVIATHWGVTKDDCFYFLVPTFSSSKWNKYSPGKILLQNLLEWSIDNNFSVFDFTIGAENYKKVYCNSKFELFHFVKFVSFKSHLLWLYYKFVDFAYNSNKVKSYIIFLIQTKNKLINGFKK
tara:strand:+ start:306 stop:1433 length:1128 start_codon:yes stop_codon:yes gene_type:complete